MIDFDRLREDLKSEYLGAFFGGKFGVALIESFDIDEATDEELIKIAINNGIDVDKYRK